MTGCWLIASRRTLSTFTEISMIGRVKPSAKNAEQASQIGMSVVVDVIFAVDIRCFSGCTCIEVGMATNASGFPTEHSISRHA